MPNWKDVKKYSKKVWRFFWDDDSAWSLALNVLVAFVVIYFIVYPLLGLLLGTSFPIVAVVSESMEHGLHNDKLCDQRLEEFKESFDNYWDVCGSWYEERGINKETFLDFPLSHGFNKGDVIILWRADRDNLEIGDVLIFQSGKPQPIIHRIISTMEEDGQVFYSTKGDHNPSSISELGENKIPSERIYGKGIIRIPYLGWIKIMAVEALRPFGIIIER
ncbi:signal peptidase I [Candidatus Woesearchaeota archaeon CG10_big_fil_rev_8_21_14_0_10_45_16]|nr:MAG: signal peptidase I [Candidatus Woesearchaeota archaeon CG10_big_fil_rev_8_21_14_0_10_45_16]